MQRDLSRAKNPDLRASLAALKRASELARRRAIQTNTEIVIVEAGRVRRISAAQLRRQMRQTAPAI